jgi:hypothetical protein
MAAVGAAIVLVLFGSIGVLGGWRWWRSRRPLVQILLMIGIPVLLLASGLLVLLQFLDTPLEDAAGLMFGLGLTSSLLLVATSYLIEQIRVAFSPQDDPPNDE